MPPDPPSLCMLHTHCADSLHLPPPNIYTLSIVPPPEQNSEIKPEVV